MSSLWVVGNVGASKRGSPFRDEIMEMQRRCVGVSRGIPGTKSRRSDLAFFIYLRPEKTTRTREVT